MKPITRKLIQLQIPFKTGITAMNVETKGEVNNQPSLTIPDQSMTVKEIMRRHTIGLPIGGGKVEIWEGDEITPDFKNMDLADRQEFIENSKIELSGIKDKFSRDEKAKETAKRKKEIDEAVAEAQKNSTNVS